MTKDYQIINTHVRKSMSFELRPDPDKQTFS